jgi:hypothetical protein
MTKFLRSALIVFLPLLAFGTACQKKCPEVAPTAERPSPMSWRVAGAYLDDIFEKIPSSSVDDFRRHTPEEERKRVNASHGDAGLKSDHAHVYGEMLDLSVTRVMSHIGVNESDVIYDLGCGRGRFLMFTLMTSPVKKAVGVELATSRVNIAKQAQKMLNEQGLIPRGKVLEFYEQDMTKARIDDATIIYMDSVLFSDELLMKVANNMSKLKNLRWIVMITKGLPENPWFEQVGSEPMPVTWSPQHGAEILFFKPKGAATHG